MIPSYAFHLGWHFAASDSPTVSGRGILAFPPFLPQSRKNQQISQRNRQNSAKFRVKVLLKKVEGCSIICDCKKNILYDAFRKLCSHSRRSNALRCPAWDEDCMLTELWRRSPQARAEGARVNTLNSQAKGQRPSFHDDFMFF
jgi:hypothetical protein